MLIGMAAQGAATYCMFKYKFLRSNISKFSMHAAHVHNSDITASVILSMTFPTILLLLLNIEYFLLLFWPGKRFPRRYTTIKKWSMRGITVGMVATIVLSTVVVATRTATISGVDTATAQQLTALYFRPPFKYRSWAQNIVWLVLMWIAVVFNIVCAILMELAILHEEKNNSGLETDIVSNSDNASTETGTVAAMTQKEGMVKEPSELVIDEKGVL
ncbi:hypothetical protein GALMADRAFT_143095 [Galerina marginata CBS 339.88]|uniref:Uncharacterized protein n=1 Tax=Galerina marginata (strain CBS 339.88) TaxID=685588 RepID=A0A067SMT9_GALM3|nr:hypothetical protein GALMADRAFT_143095 [Galerina marginata CBS 339.88]